MITNVNNDIAWKLGLKKRLWTLQKRKHIGASSLVAIEKMTRTLNLRYNKIDLKLKHLEGVASAREAKLGLRSNKKKCTPGEPTTLKFKKTNSNFKKVASEEIAGNRSRASGEPPRGATQK